MILRKTSSLLQRISRHLLPSSCILCGQANSEHTNLCQLCRHSLPFIQHGCSRCALPFPASVTSTNTHASSCKLCGRCQHHPPYFDQIFAPLTYEFPTDHLMNRFKHQGKFACGALLCDLLIDYLKDSPAQNSIEQKKIPATVADFIVPIPLHWQRQFHRGFNQADWIARRISRQLQIPINQRLVSRIAHTPSQQGLNRKQRLNNLRESFQIRPSQRNNIVREKTILLVDDVMTTGSTFNIIAKLLKANGAAKVMGACLARTPHTKARL